MAREEKHVWVFLEFLRNKHLLNRSTHSNELRGAKGDTEIEKILKFIFNSSNNYIEKFQSIEYENSKEEVNLKKALEDFLIKEKLTLEHIKQNKIIIKKFVSYLNLNQYKFSKKEVSDIFNISRSTLYRWLDE